MTKEEALKAMQVDFQSNIKVFDKVFKEDGKPAAGLKHIVTRVVVQPDWFYADPRGRNGELLLFGGKKKKVNGVWTTEGGNLVMHNATSNFLMDLAGISMEGQMVIDPKKVRDSDFPSFQYTASVSGNLSGRAMTPSGMPKIKTVHVGYDVAVRVDEEVIADMLKDGETKKGWNGNPDTTHKSKYGDLSTTKQKMLVLKRKLEVSKHAENITASKLYTKLFEKMVGIESFKNGDVGSVLYISKMVIDTDNPMVRDQYIPRLIGGDSSSGLYGGNQIENKQAEPESQPEQSPPVNEPEIENGVHDADFEVVPDNVPDAQPVTQQSNQAKTPKMELEMWCESDNLSNDKDIKDLFEVIADCEKTTKIVEIAVYCLRGLSSGESNREDYLASIMRLCYGIPEIKAYRNANGLLSDKILEAVKNLDLVKMEGLIKPCKTVLEKKRYGRN